MGNGFSLDTPAKGAEAPKVAERKGFDLERIKSYWLEENDIKPKLISLVIGQDGTAKSGLIAEYLTNEEIKEGYKMLVVDLDGGFSNLLPVYHKDRCEKQGKKVSDVYLVKNPLTLNNEGDIDYKQTYQNIKEAIFFVKNYGKELKIKAFVFDGLSTALHYAENLMRIEKNLTVEGGVSIAFWKIRNNHFLNILEQIKSLPVDSFFIGHENFILADKDNSSVMIKTSAMVHQKIIMNRKVDKLTNTVKFIATIDKSKNNILAEGSDYEVIVLDKTKGTFKVKTLDLFNDLK